MIKIELITSSYILAMIIVERRVHEIQEWKVFLTGFWWNNEYHSSILTWINDTYIQKPNYKAIHASSTIIATKNYFSYLVHKRCWGPNFVWLRKMCARQRFYATHPMRILLPQLLRYREHCAQKKQTLILAWKTKLQLQQQQNKSS